MKTQTPTDNRPLIQLTNGAWLRLNTITAIRPLMTEKGNIGDLHRARVVVHHGDLHEVLLANDNEHAQAMADELAALVACTDTVNEELRPCNEPCSKCGSLDIQRELRRGRGSIIYDIPERLKTKGRGASESHPYYPLLGEYLRHQCRCCGFVWGSDCYTTK